MPFTKEDREWLESLTEIKLKMRIQSIEIQFANDEPSTATIKLEYNPHKSSLAIYWHKSIGFSCPCGIDNCIYLQFVQNRIEKFLNKA